MSVAEINNLTNAIKKILMDVIFPDDTFSDGKVRAVLADRDYEKDSSWACDSGIAWARRHLQKTKEPLLILGFDREECVRKRDEGSLLDVSGVGYVRLPARLEIIRETIEKLRHIKPHGLDCESAKRNVEDFQKELRSDFCHGPFGSIQRNFKGAITCISKKLYSDAAKQLTINLESYDRAKASLERIKTAFPENCDPYTSISDIYSLIKKIETPTCKAISLLESNPVKADFYMKKISKALTSLEKKINTIVPNRLKDK